MDMNTRWTYYLLLVVLGGLSMIISCKNGRDLGREDAWGPVEKGLRLRIWSDRTVFEVGRKVEVRCSYRNVSSTNIILWASGFWPNNRILVFDSRGSPVSETDLGRQRSGVFAPHGE